MQTDRVYIVTGEPYHDNSTVLGAFTTLEGAMSSVPVEWKTDSFCVRSYPSVVATAKTAAVVGVADYDDLFIYAMPLCAGKTSEETVPQTKNEEPVAQPLVSDSRNDSST